MALAAPPVSDRRRVKVYELKNNDWFDRGTGFCTAVHTNVSRRARAPPPPAQC
jgi:protein phosphatase-4 regulatory subunit 3